MWVTFSRTPSGKSKLEGFGYIVVLGENNWVKSEMQPFLCILAATIQIQVPIYSDYCNVPLTILTILSQDLYIMYTNPG